MWKKQAAYILYIFVFLLASFVMALGAGQEPQSSFNPAKTYPLDQLKQDFSLFRLALEEGHAGITAYSSQEEINRMFEESADKLNYPLTELDFFRLLQSLIAGLNDGHTGLSLSAEYDRYLSQEPVLFPFNLKFIRKKAYIFRNYSNRENIPLGVEVASINNQPIPKILEALLPLIASDGRIQTSKYRRLEKTNFFSRLFLSEYGKVTSYTIVTKSRENNSREEIVVPGITSENLDRIFQERYPETAQIRPPLELTWKENIPILTIRTFSDRTINNTRFFFPTILRKAFKEIANRKANHLIIDLRDNGGGADLYGKILFAYLIDQPFMYYKYLGLNRNTYSFLEHTNSPDLNATLQRQTKENDRGSYDLQMHPNLGMQKPIKPTFSGQVYVLINGGSFSGSGETTSLMHYHKKATFIGEECGAGYYGNTSGIMPTLTLPNTKLRIKIPMVRYEMAVSGYEFSDRGIIPDYPFTRNIKDYLTDKDSEMEFALDLINKKEKNQVTQIRK